MGLSVSHLLFLLGKPSVLKIVYILHRYLDGRAEIHKIPRYGVGVQSVYDEKTIGLLLKFGLAHAFKCGNTMCLELTRRGKQVGELLEKIDELLSS